MIIIVSYFLIERNYKILNVYWEYIIFKALLLI